MSEAIFVSGIDTDAGKSYVTGWYARQLMEQGHNVITQKFIQTGNTDTSEDILLHRRIMGIGLQPVDHDHTTAPVIFTFPASAQLAAQLDGRSIDLDTIDCATQHLKSIYSHVLIEGAGGLMVPISDDFLTIDYIATRALSVMLVTNARLGSINHTVLSLEALQRRGIKLHSLAFNHHFDSDPVIAADTRAWLGRYMQRHHSDTPVIDIPSL